jgi:uncharacterized damage-inducible protein DinB
MLLEYLRSFYAYNAWANEKILVKSADVPYDDFIAPLEGVSFGSLRDTLSHTVLVQQNWLRRWQGVQRVEWPPLEEFGPDCATIHVEWARIEAETQAFIQTLDEAGLDRKIGYISRAGEYYAYPLGRLMLHQVNHATQHRSEAAVILTRLGRSPGNWDYPIFLDEIHENT